MKLLSAALTSSALCVAMVDRSAANGQQSSSVSSAHSGGARDSGVRSGREGVASSLSRK